MGPIELANYVQQQGDLGRQRGTQNRLAQLASQAYAAPAEQQRGFVQQAIQTDPTAGFALGQSLGQDRNSRIQSMSQKARMLVGYAKAGNRQGVDSLYPQIAQEAAAVGLGQNIPPAWDDSYLPGMEQLASIGGGQQSLAPRVIGDALVDSSGNELYRSPQKDRYEWDATRGVWVPHPGNGAAETKTAQGGAPDRAAMEADIALANELAQAGIDPDRIDAFLSARGQRASQVAASGQAPAQPSLAAIPVAGIGPKVDAPAEETFSQPQPVTYPDGSVRMVQFGNRGGRREVQGVSPAPTDRDVKPPTEGERSAAGYLQRMEASEVEIQALRDAGYDSTNLRDHYTAGEGALLNWAASDQGQHNRQQQEDWVRAKLRKESGAVIGAEEMDREIKTYFPQPGDRPDVIQSKARSRQRAIEQMKQMAGRAAPGGYRPTQPTPADGPAPAPQPAPGGWGIQRVR